MQLLLLFARAYPKRSFVMLGCLLLATVAEGVGFSTILPVLSLATQIGSAGRQSSAQGGNEFGRAVERMLASVGLHPTIGLLCGIIVAGLTLEAIFLLLAQKQIGYTVAHVATDLRLSLLRAVLAARWDYYVRQPIGAVANAFTAEASRAAESYLYATSIVATVLQIFLYMALALAISWRVMLGALLLGFIVAFVLGRLVRIARQAGARQTRVLKSVLSQLTDVLYTAKPLKAMAREILIGPLLEDETQRLNRALQREILGKEALRAVQGPFVMIVLTGGLYFALTQWALALDTILAMAVFCERILGSVNKLQRQYQALATSESAFWSLRATIDLAMAEEEIFRNGMVPRLQHGITLEHLSLSYESRPILRDISCFIPAGQVTAIVGPSGGGKTSLADIIIGLTQPQTGTVRIDDTSLDSIDVRAWRWQVGYVPQELFLLHDSILTNVSMGDSRVTEAEVEAALRAAHAWEFISALPEGVHTLAGERGARFSGGQRQRIAIARALVHNPQVLILDEATASLDPESEAAICAAVRQLRGSMTILIISHQPALLETADIIYHLENGVLRRDAPVSSPVSVAANL